MTIWWLSYPLLGVFAGFVAGLFGVERKSLACGESGIVGATGGPRPVESRHRRW